MWKKFSKIESDKFVVKVHNELSATKQSIENIYLYFKGERSSVEITFDQFLNWLNIVGYIDLKSDKNDNHSRKTSYVN